MTTSDSPSTHSRAKTPDDYRALAKRRGFHWLGSPVPDTRAKTQWKCSQGHHWQTTYSSIQQGKGCPVCAHHPRKTPADYRALAKVRGLKWLGPEVQRTDIKTTWQCARGHRWQSKYHTIQERGGCPVCAGKLPKASADYYDLARQQGLRWIGPFVPNVATKTTWQCASGHRWQAKYNSIQQGHGCPVCSGDAPKTPADYHALAEAREMKWLGPEVSNVATKTTWQCTNGHSWQTTYNTIQQGHGCPVCAGKAPKMPADYRALAKTREMKWLGPEVANVATRTTWQCARGHRWQTTYNVLQRGSGCPVCAHHVRRTPADYHALAKARTIKWLGPEVDNVGTKTTWQCASGHRWQAKYNSLQQGHGCPVCTHHIPMTPADYHALAKARGLKWLGPKAPNTQTKTRWQCSLGHEWTACYGTLQQGHGCPICAGGRRTAAHYQQLAIECGFQWLGPEVSTVRTDTRWRCGVGHEWEASYQRIEQGHGCPVCAKKSRLVFRRSASSATRP